MIYQFIPTLDNKVLNAEISKFGIQSTPGCEFKINDDTYTIGNTGYYESPDSLYINNIVILGVSPKSGQQWETFIPKNTIITYEKYISSTEKTEDDSTTSISYSYSPKDSVKSVLGYYSSELDSFELDVGFLY